VKLKKPGIINRIGMEIAKGFDHGFDFVDWLVDGVTGKGEYSDTGSGGERRTYNIVRELFPTHLVFRNVYITKADGKTTEIDLLAISNKGIFVIESKNYSGWIFGSDTERNWTMTLPNRQKHRFYNPIWQNAGHIKALVENLNDRYPQMEYYSLVVFSERCELKKITNNEPDTYVFQRPELRFYVRQINREHPHAILSDEDVEDIAVWLKTCERPDEGVCKQHLQQLKQAANTCPRCGSPLVERHNSKTGDVFFGCSGYPHCRYTRKSE
jgi:ssDNA-binding Zn-finger/Zn-ribbon topoisomerase 1